ncbi:MAG: aryl-sulfate sulfotransferase [Bacteroidota bacterium]
MQKATLLFALLCLLIPRAHSQPLTVGLIQADQNRSEIGYTLFAPMRSTETYLVDNCGRVVNQWSSGRKPGLSTYLTPDGNLLRAQFEPNNPTFFSGGGRGGRLQMFNWSGDLIWDYLLSDPWEMQHHDLIPLPNGNVLTLVWSLRTAPECIAAGRKPFQINDNELWSEKLVELRPIFPDSAEVVWEWDAWDHLIQDFDSTQANYGPVRDHPELLDINVLGLSYGGRDWLHANGINYNPELDQILMSIRHTNEIYIIDHSTTTAEAAGHTGGRAGKGGDFLFRWGSDVVFRRDYYVDRDLHGQHNPTWIPEGRPDAGKIMVFNNGCQRPSGVYSEVLVLDPIVEADGNYQLLPDSTYYPDVPYRAWSAPVPEDFFAKYVSGAQMLPNGNFLISQGTDGRLIEVTPDNEIVWEYINPDAGSVIVAQGDTLPPGTSTYYLSNPLFRAFRYFADDPALVGKSLVAGAPIEPNPAPSDCRPVSATPTAPGELPRIYPNPATQRVHVAFPQPQTRSYRVGNALGQIWRQGTTEPGRLDLEVADWPAGMYWIQITGFAPTRLLVQ